MMFMESLYYTLKKSRQHVFPFELLDYFELECVHELCDIQTKREFYEVVFREKMPEHNPKSLRYYKPNGYLKSRLEDFPMVGKPVYLIFHRQLWLHQKNGVLCCRRISPLAGKLRLKKEIKHFLQHMLYLSTPQSAVRMVHQVA